MGDTRVITEGELKDIVGAVLVKVAGSPDGTVVTKYVNRIMKAYKTYSKEQELVELLDRIKSIVDTIPEQEFTEGVNDNIAREQDTALHDIYGLLVNEIARLKI